MKNFTCAFVFAIAFTGLSAAAYSCVAATQNLNGVSAAKASAFPIPSCPLNDPNACGMGGPNPNVVSTR